MDQHDILFQLFEHMKAKEIKNVRLVNRLWDYCARHYLISKYNKIANLFNDQCRNFLLVNFDRIFMETKNSIFCHEIDLDDPKPLCKQSQRDYISFLRKETCFLNHISLLISKEKFKQALAFGKLRIYPIVKP